MSFRYLRRIYLGDTDAAGVVYFARGLEICHEAYEESLDSSELEIGQMLNEGIVALPIIHAQIDYLKPLFCGDRLHIQLEANQINQSEFAIKYQVFKSNNLEKASIIAKTKHVCIDPQTRIRVDLPTQMLNWLQRNYSQEL